MVKIIKLSILHYNLPRPKSVRFILPKIALN